MQVTILLLLTAVVTAAQSYRRPLAHVESCAVSVPDLDDPADLLSDARDGELVCRQLSRRRLTPEESSETEAAALRRLERRKAVLTKQQSPAAEAEVESAARDYVLAVSRTALAGE